MNSQFVDLVRPQKLLELFSAIDAFRVRQAPRAGEIQLRRASLSDVKYREVTLGHLEQSPPHNRSMTSRPTPADSVVSNCNDDAALRTRTSDV
jgi:hypothetical protein